MTDKEERILIIPCRSKCNCIRPVGNELYCGAYIHGDWVKIDPEKDCKDCKRAEYNGITRAEAIERMARALYAKYEVMCNSDDCPNDGPTCEDCPIWKKYEEMAEAALDALIK